MYSVFYGAISLDGFLSDQNDNLQWLFDTDSNNTSTYEKFEQNVDTFIMGGQLTKKQNKC